MKKCNKCMFEIRSVEDEEKAIKSILFTFFKTVQQGEFDVKYLTSTRTDKIVYKIIKILNLPITYSWYLRGAYIHTSGTIHDMLDPKKWNSTMFSDAEFSEEVGSKIMKLLNDIRYVKEADFITDFYNTETPKEYKDLYIANNMLLDLTNMKRNTVDDILNNVDSISDCISRLHMALLKNDIFSEDVDIFMESTNLIEGVLFKLNANREGISERKKRFLENIYTWYFDKVWKIPALKISFNTVTGIRKDNVYEIQKNKYNKLKDETIHSINKNKSFLEIQSLIPTSKDIEANITTKFSLDTRLKISSI